MIRDKSDRFLHHCGLLHMRRFVEHISGAYRFIQLESTSQGQPTSRVTLWGEYHQNALVCPDCTQAQKCWYLPTLLHFTAGSTVIIAESDGYLAVGAGVFSATGRTHTESMLDYAAEHFTASSSVVGTGLSFETGFASRHSRRLEGVSHPVKFDDGTERSVRYVMTDLRRYPIPSTAYSDLESRFPLHMALWANKQKKGAHAEHAYDILMGGLGASSDEVWKSCVPFAREIVHITVGPAHGLSQADVAQVADDAYLVRPELFDREYADMQEEFDAVVVMDVVTSLFAPLMDIGSVLGIEREVGVERTAFVHGLYGGFHLDNVALMLQMRGGRFRVTRHSGGASRGLKMKPSCLNVDTLRFVVPRPKRSRVVDCDWTTTAYRARLGAHVFSVDCGPVASEYPPGSRVVLSDGSMRAEDEPTLEVVSVDIYAAGPVVGSSDALMQELLRVLQEATCLPATWAVMAPEQAASFDRALQLGFPPSSERVGAFGAAVVERLVGPGDWRGLVDKAVAAHVGQHDGAKLLSLPRQTAATYNAWVEYIEALFVPVTAVCQYAAATAPLASADQLVFVVVDPARCNTVRVMFEAMGARQAAAHHHRRVKQRV